MSANPLELISAYGGLAKPAQLEAPFPSERRKRARTRLHWPVLLFRNHTAEAIESITRDLSSGGFYCLAKVPFTPGELLTCTLKVPTHDPNGKHLERSLECKVRVMRVELQEGGEMFGIACRIEDYHFAHVAEAGPMH
ncbi:MAG TPA: PilZ domain-containing protein [Bryobacteraceae bacterium]